MALETSLVIDRERWDTVVDAFPAHPLQSFGWGELKATTGPWEVRRLLVSEAGEPVGGASVLVRRLPAPFGSMAHVPRGPFVLDPTRLGEVADAVAEWVRREVRPVCLKIEPGVPSVTLSSRWRPGQTVFIPTTAVMDLTLPEDELRASIHSKKARQYIRKAEREGVSVRDACAGDLDRILELYRATAAADGFGIHEDSYYRRAFDVLGDVNQVFVAEQDGVVQAFLWNITTRDCAFELWGAVDEDGKRSHANHLLKWRAMLAAQERGAALYDMNGLLNDGISKFKLLFAGEPTVWAGTYDRPLSPLYRAFNLALKLRERSRS